MRITTTSSEGSALSCRGVFRPSALSRSFNLSLPHRPCVMVATAARRDGVVRRRGVLVDDCCTRMEPHGRPDQTTH